MPTLMPRSRIADNLSGYRFGEAGGVDPYDAQLGVDKRKSHSIRRRVDAIAKRVIDYEPGEEISREKLIAALSDNGRWPVTGADLIAATRFAKALNGSDIMLQAITEDIDGKLKEQIEHTVKPADLTNDERAERIQALMLAARQRSQPVIEHDNQPNPDV